MRIAARFDSLQYSPEHVIARRLPLPWSFKRALAGIHRCHRQRTCGDSQRTGDDLQ